MRQCRRCDAHDTLFGLLWPILDNRYDMMYINGNCPLPPELNFASTAIISMALSLACGANWSSVLCDLCCNQS